MTDYTDEELALIRRSACAERIKDKPDRPATDDEFAQFMYMVRKANLDPIVGHIYAVWRKGRMKVEFGIDGLRLIAQRTGRYAGMDAPVFASTKPGHPDEATVTVWKLVGGQRCGFTASALWSEYEVKGPQGFMWTNRPFGQLAKCAEALALRKAFPLETSERVEPEVEAMAGDQVVKWTATVEPPAPEPRAAATGPTPEQEDALVRRLKQEVDAVAFKTWLASQELFPPVEEWGEAPPGLSAIDPKALMRLVANTDEAIRLFREWEASRESDDIPEEKIPF